MLCPLEVRGGTGEAEVHTKSTGTRVGTELHRQAWEMGKPEVKRLLFDAWK